MVLKTFQFTLPEIIILSFKLIKEKKIIIKISLVEVTNIYSSVECQIASIFRVKGMVIIK